MSLEHLLRAAPRPLPESTNERVCVHPVQRNCDRPGVECLDQSECLIRRETRGHGIVKSVE
jgi:hypothetical protein